MLSIACSALTTIFTLWDRSGLGNQHARLQCYPSVSANLFQRAFSTIPIVDRTWHGWNIQELLYVLWLSNLGLHMNIRKFVS